MKKLALLIMIMCFALHGKATNYADYVNPLIGTQSTYEFSSGNTYPAIARPWGMNFWTPQTGKMGDGWQYMYTATKIRGFKQTHQPSPWINDYVNRRQIMQELLSVSLLEKVKRYTPEWLLLSSVRRRL